MEGGKKPKAVHKKKGGSRERNKGFRKKKESVRLREGKLLPFRGSRRRPKANRRMNAFVMDKGKKGAFLGFEEVDEHIGKKNRGPRRGQQSRAEGLKGKRNRGKLGRGEEGISDLDIERKNGRG